MNLGSTFAICYPTSKRTQEYAADALKSSRTARATKQNKRGKLSKSRKSVLGKRSHAIAKNRPFAHCVTLMR